MIIIINTMIRIGNAISKNDAQISPSVSIMLSSNALIINDLYPKLQTYFVKF